MIFVISRKSVPVRPAHCKAEKKPNGGFPGFRFKAGMTQQTHPTSTPPSPSADTGPEVDPDWPALGRPCLAFCQDQLAGISRVGPGHFPGFQGLFSGISSWRPGIRRLSPRIRRFSRRWDQRLFFPHPLLLPLAWYSWAQYFWRRGFMRARRRKPTKAERRKTGAAL